MPPFRPPHRVRDAEALATRVERRLAVESARTEYLPLSAGTRPQISAVMFLLGPARRNGPAGDGISLILNKRSAMVRQAGDLCCPGGGVTPVVDRLLAGLLKLPATPLTNWSQWSRWRGAVTRRTPASATDMAAKRRFRMLPRLRESPLRGDVGGRRTVDR